MIGGKAEALELQVKKSGASPSFVGVPIMNLKMRDDVIIGCITRKGKMIIPKGNDTLEYGDTVVIVTTAAQTNKIASLTDIFEKGH